MPFEASLFFVLPFKCDFAWAFLRWLMTGVMGEVIIGSNWTFKTLGMKVDNVNMKVLVMKSTSYKHNMLMEILK